MFSKAILNDIRDRVSVAGFIGERIQLKKAGRNFKGLCPFHNEKTPSFNVSDDKQIYHCFGCGEGGDIFDFVMKFDNLNFAEAVKYLAGIAGVELPRDDKTYDRDKEAEHAKKKRYAFRINDIVRDFFKEALSQKSQGGNAQEYLQVRGISGEISTQHFLGYADNSWNSLASHLQQKGVPMELASELGLLKKRDDGSYYDFFRNRLIFPIISPRGEVLGFGGRALEDMENGEKIAKYLNSADSLIYHKSNSVYGLDKAKIAIRDAGSVILVEGYMDLIALHQAGIKNVVAPLGTAFTQGHLRLLSRYSRDMTLLFDGDEAGIRAALRTLETFIEFGSMPRVVPLPEGEDPDTLVRKEGEENFRKRLDEARSLFEFFVDKTAREAKSGAAGKVMTISHIVPFLRMMKDPVEQSIYTKITATRVGVEEADIVKAIQMNKGSRGVEAIAVKKEEKKVPSSAELTLIQALLGKPETIKSVFDVISADSFRDEWCRNVAQVMQTVCIENSDVTLNLILEEIDDDELSTQLRAMSVEGSGCKDEELEELIHDCVQRIQGRPKLERLEEINEDIRRAEIDGDEQKLFKLLEEKRELALQKHG